MADLAFQPEETVQNEDDCDGDHFQTAKLQVAKYTHTFTYQ